MLLRLAILLLLDDVDDTDDGELLVDDDETDEEVYFIELDDIVWALWECFRFRALFFSKFRRSYYYYY